MNKDRAPIYELSGSLRDTGVLLPRLNFRWSEDFCWLCKAKAPIYVLSIHLVIFVLLGKIPPGIR